MILYLADSNGQVRVLNQVTSNLTWQSSTDTLGQEMSFDIAYSDMPFIPDIPVDLGETVLLFTDDFEEILRTVVVEENKNGRSARSYKTFDVAFYLNKSKTVYQFNEMRADKAISKICGDYNVPIGSIVSIPTVIDEIYNGKSPAEIIKEILSQAKSDQGIEYVMEMRQGQLYIEKQEELLIQATFDLANNITGISKNFSISNPQRKRSIDKMRNNIKAVNGEDEVVYEAGSAATISNYGLLEETIDVSDMGMAEIRNVTRNKLNELNKIFEDNSLTLLGDPDVRAGRLMDFREPITGITGRYKVKSVTHNYTNGIHTMDLNLEVV